MPLSAIDEPAPYGTTHSIAVQVRVGRERGVEGTVLTVVGLHQSPWQAVQAGGRPPVIA